MRDALLGSDARCATKATRCLSPDASFKSLSSFLSCGGVMATNTSKEFLRVNIDLPSFRLEISTANPGAALTELRKILECVNLDEEVMYEEFVTQELKTVFSETFMRNGQAMSSIRKLLKQEEDYRVSTAEIPSEVTVDVEHNTRAVSVQRRDIKEAVAGMTREVESECVKHAIVHINGDIERDTKLLIIDHIHKHIPLAQLRAFQSKTPDAKVMVECIFFGEFPEEED